MINLRHFRKPLVIGAALLVTVGYVQGQDKKAEYLIPSSTISPDHRYGVLVPIFDFDEDNSTDNRENKLVEVRTGRVLATIHAEVGYDRALNFVEVLPSRWSTDGSLLLWEVAGKWSPNALVLLKIEKGKAKWQIDLLTTAQQAILSRTRKVAPRRYQAAKIENAGNGSDYPDGFTVNVTTDGEGSKAVSLPLVVHASLTSNPKDIPGFPANLDAQLDGVVNDSGKFTVTKFALSPHEP